MLHGRATVWVKMRNCSFTKNDERCVQPSVVAHGQGAQRDGHDDAPARAERHIMQEGRTARQLVTDRQFPGIDDRADQVNHALRDTQSLDDDGPRLFCMETKKVNLPRCGGT